MTPTRRQVVPVVIGFAAAIAWWIVDSTSPWPTLVALGTGIVIAEQLDLKAPRRAPLTTVHAFVLVLIKVASRAQFVIVVPIAEAVGVAVRKGPAWRERPLLYLERLGSAAAGFLVYHQIVAHWHAGEKTVVITALAAAGLAQLAVGELVRFGREGTWAFAWRTRGGELALLSSGMLMAVAYNGIDGNGGFGLWAPILFFIPLLATWYSFRQLDGINRAMDQTMRVLERVPEIGAWVPPGHTERVVELALAVGRSVGLDRAQLYELEIAARLEYLGHACMEDPEYSGEEHDPALVAGASAAALRASGILSPAADVLSSMADEIGGPGVRVSPQTRLAGQVLLVVRDFDLVTQGERSRIYAGLAAVTTDATDRYDPRAADALARVIVRRDFFGRRN